MITIKHPKLEKDILEATRLSGDTVEGYLVNVLSYLRDKEQFDFNIDFREEKEDNLSKKLISDIKEARRCKKDGFIDLSQKYAKNR